MSVKVRVLFLAVVVGLVAILVIAALRQNRITVALAQNNRSARTSDNKQSVRQVPEITSKDSPRQHLTISPSGHHIVYHGSFDPYKSSPESPVFTVVDTKTGKKSQIAVDWPARYVSSVRWIDDRFVLVRGEGAFLAILDAKFGKQTHNLVGADFSVSPDEKKIAYHYDFNPLRGYIPPARQSDYVLLAVVQHSPDSRSPKTNYKVIYPDSLGWGVPERKIYSDLEERHQVRSALVWAPDSRMIAFVAHNQHKMWLTVLELQMLNEDVSISHRRFDLGPRSDGELKVSWSPRITQIRISNDNTAWLVDLRAGTVTPAP